MVVLLIIDGFVSYIHLDVQAMNTYVFAD
jgi:hypothetical protein